MKKGVFYRSMPLSAAFPSRMDNARAKFGKAAQ
jgi:hypothetical protein